MTIYLRVRLSLCPPVHSFKNVLKHSHTVLEGKSVDNFKIVTSTRRLCLWVCLFVCVHNYSKNSEQIFFLKILMWVGPGQMNK